MILNSLEMVLRKLSEDPYTPPHRMRNICKLAPSTLEPPRERFECRYGGGGARRHHDGIEMRNAPRFVRLSEPL